ncbi:MAG: penicillin acylase family protein [Spirochaetales bacterium]|nr:penicillin acylase family protein [Spirochaetales bacterium]
MKRTNALLSLVVRRGMRAAPGEVQGLPLSAGVEVLQDRFGIPHVFAENERDLMVAQGFLHAKERLWQMETLRRLAAGTLAEVAGEAAVDLDHFSRLAGFSNLQTRPLARLTPAERELFQGYADGANACLALCGDELPLEFRTLKLRPRPYAVEELGGTIAVNSWFLQTNYMEELIALLDRDTLDGERWDELFASGPGESLPAEGFFERFRGAKIAPLLRAALAFYPSLAPRSGGSNSWVAARGPGNKPLLANDPHLDTMVPQVWFFCHLHCPTLNVAGASMAGLPGIVIGRNENVAWSMTNVMTDCTDLYVLPVDPGHPTRYRAGGRTLEMESRREIIRIAGGREREVTIYTTVHGPVITEVKPGSEAVVALKWYGTLPEERFEDTTLRALLAMPRARDAAQFVVAARDVASVGENLVFADVHGSIGRYATGRIPVRRGYSGRLPADGSGECDWEGFVSSKENPLESDPTWGTIVTANQKPAGPYPYSVSFSWAAPYRHERISELLGGLARPEIGDFQRMQLDRYSKRAEHLLPTVLAFSYQEPAAREAAALLRDWDRNLDAGSVAGSLFTVFLVEFSRVLLKDMLRNSLPAFLAWMPFMYTAPDRLLDARYAGPSTRAARLLGGRSLAEVCEQALARSVEFLEQNLGRSRRRWVWGALHRYLFRHPGATGPLVSWVLNRGPYPAGGSANTVNAANFDPGSSNADGAGRAATGAGASRAARREAARKGFQVTTIPSLRMVISLADPDGTTIMGPMGQSGRPGFRHYADMIRPWMAGRATPLPLTRIGAESIAVSRTLMRP